MGKNEKDLGITYQPCTCEVVTSVIFDKNHKLIIGGEKTDLFANFKNLQPGCTRSQTIRLANNSDLNIKMSLRAEAAKQNKYSKKNLELIRKLLTSYAKIEILENNKVLYHGTVDGNLTKKGWSMKKDISLGEFKPGAGKNLIVKLSLSEEMDNEYQELLGKVKWVFSASQASSDSSSGQNGMVTGGTMTMRTMEMTEITEITEITAEVEIKAEMESMAKTETVVEVDTTVEGKA